MEISGTKETTRATANHSYKLKLCLTYLISVCVIVATWVLFIVSICIGAYAVLTTSVKNENYNNELSKNLTFLNTLSNSDECPYNTSEAFMRHKYYSDWFNSNMTTSNSAYATLIKNTTCVSRFVNNGTQCTPKCIAYFPGGDDYFIAWRVIATSGSSLTVLVSFLGIVTWVKIGGVLWRFPHIVFFYLLITVFLQSILIFIGQILPQRFYCKHDSLFASRTDTSIPCNIQGAIFQYSSMAFLYWYLFAVINLTYIATLRGSVDSGKFAKYKHWIHLIESVFCWLFPLLIQTGTIALTKRYTFNNHPSYCYPQDIYVLVTLYIPGVIICLYNGTAIPIIIGIVLKRRFLFKKLIGEPSNTTLDWLVQMGVFTVAFTFSLWMLMIFFTITRLHAPGYNAYLRQYSVCVTIFGAYGANCCKPVYREYYNSEFALTFVIFDTVWGIAALSALANKDVRDLWKNILSCNKHWKK